jgi:hypothetical protein
MREWLRSIGLAQGGAPVAAIALLCAAGLAVNLSIAFLNRAGWGVDFNQFYSAARLAGTHHLYDWSQLRRLEAENGIEIPTGRLPVVVYGYKIFAALPFPIARILWTFLCIAALASAAAVWPGVPRRWMIAAVAWSLPATLGVLHGQEVSFWLLFLAISLRWMEKRPVSSGAALSLLISKYHLALAFPVMLAARKRWTALLAAAASVCALLGASFLIEGPRWPLDSLRMLRQPGFSPAAERMPNLLGTASWLPWTTALEFAGAAAVLALLWTACRKNRDLALLGAVAAACGLLLSHHAYASDCALLIPLSVLTATRRNAPPWLKIWAITVLSPIPVLLLVSSTPFPGQALIVGFVIAAVLFMKNHGAGQETGEPQALSARPT